MSYLVLARKYRPRNFDTIVGQEHVVRALTHALETQRLHHAYLFTGTRGIGKTTLSRILAKSLNCETGITSKSCGKCEACTAIDNDRFVDYIEMDAASNRGVGDIQQILEQAVYAPTNARFKVYMIDEVHMLTPHAFNAMLKTLEEPPEYVKFILATTDPQKLPVTVLSRCLQFNLKQMPAQQIVGHLENILTQENIEYETPALRLIAKGARGSMRDALSLTDQAIAFSAGKINLEAMQSMLGAVDQTYLIRILYALAEKDGKTMIDIADEMAQRALSYENALQDLAGLLHRIAVAQTVPEAIASDLPEREDIFRLAAVFSPEETQLFYQITLRGLSEMSLSPDDYAGFTITLLRMLAFRPEETPEPAVRAQTRQSAENATPTATQQKTTQSSPPSGAKAALEMLRGKSKTEPRTNATAAAEKKTPESSAIKQTPTKPDWDGDWIKLSQTLDLRGMARQLAQQSELISRSFEQGVLELNLRLENKTLAGAANMQRLQAELEKHFNCKVTINTEFAKTVQTAENKIKEERSARIKQAEENIKNDPLVQSIIKNFDATIVQNSIKPL